MLCDQCGTMIADSATACPHCSAAAAAASVPSAAQEASNMTAPSVISVAPPTAPGPLSAPRPSPLGDDPAVRWLLPVGRSGLAIAAGYAGLFAVLIPLAPIALVLGILAVCDVRRHPEKHGLGRAIFGLVSGAFFSLLLVIMVGAILVAAQRHGL